MIFSKKWKFCLFACLFFFACKSADCGCPMAENKPVKEASEKVEQLQTKNWEKLVK